MSYFAPESGSDQNISFKGHSKTFVDNGNSDALTYTKKQNTSVVIISITEDKLKNYLRDYQDSSAYGGYALGFLGVFFTLLITLCTVSTFNSFLTISAATWQALFILSSFGFLGFFIRYTYLWIINKERLKISNLIKKIKGEPMDAKKCILKRDS